MLGPEPAYEEKMRVPPWGGPGNDFRVINVFLQRAVRSSLERRVYVKFKWPI